MLRSELSAWVIVCMGHGSLGSSGQPNSSVSASYKNSPNSRVQERHYRQNQRRGFEAAQYMSGRCLECGEHLFGMAFGLHFGKNADDFAVGADYECGALNAHHFLAVQIFFFNYAVGTRDLFARIGKQGVREIVFFLEFLLLVGRVPRNAQDYGAGLLQLFVCVAEPARFNGSAGGIGFRKEK